MLDSIVETIKSMFAEGPFRLLAVFLISMLPVLELRAGIIAGYALGLPLVDTFVTAVIGNLLPLPFVLLFVKKVFAFLKKHHILTSFVEKLENRAKQKSATVAKVEFWSLVGFVGIPLPGTGGWTGSLVASFLEMDFKKAFLACVLGVLIAGFIVSLLTYGVFESLFGVILPWAL